MGGWRSSASRGEDCSPRTDVHLLEGVHPCWVRGDDRGRVRGVSPVLYSWQIAVWVPK
jgi:hypothetical protein